MIAVIIKIATSYEQKRNLISTAIYRHKSELLSQQSHKFEDCKQTGINFCYKTKILS